MATLKIYNDIQSENQKAVASFFGEAQGVCFKDIDAFCDGLSAEDEDIDIRLHCDGGSVTEGWAIYDRLRATGKRITATVEGNCASMATVVLMAAPKERRRAYQSAHICVHNPWMCPWALGDAVTADDLQKYANDLRAEQSKMVDLYVERCGCDREEIQSLMDEDRYIDTERALELGIIGEIAAPMSAKKKDFSESKKHSMNEKTSEMDENKVEVKASVLDRILAKLGLKSLDDFKEGEPMQGMDLSTADGSTLTVDREEGSPEVGDTARPDGEHLMPDGTTIVVENGVIAEVRPKEEAPEGVDASDEQKGEDVETELDDRDEEEQRLRERIAELEKENEELRQRLNEAENNAYKKDDLRILNAVKMAGGEKALAQIASTYKPEGRQPQGGLAVKHDGKMSAEEIIDKYDKSKKNKKK
jgi:ATP-dependent Clp protease protease subunit